MKCISCKDTGIMVRKVLKEAFPGVKFTVNTKGGSLRVSYGDGPCPSIVEGVVDIFAGSYFDSAIDYQGSQYVFIDGEPASFDTSFVFVWRYHSEAGLLRGVSLLRAKYPENLKAIGLSDDEIAARYKEGNLYGVDLFLGTGSADSLRRELNSILYKLSDRFAPSPSPTRATLRSAGDDGYGQGTVGDLRNGATAPTTEIGYPHH